MSFDKTAIEEANKHLLALNERVLELDAVVKSQAEKLEVSEAENLAKIDRIIQLKDAEIQKQNAWLQSTQAEIRRLNAEMANKDLAISQLGKKASALEKALRYKRDLDGLLNCFLEAEKLMRASPESETLTAHVKPSPPTLNSDVSPQSKDLEDSESSISGEDSMDVPKHVGVVWTPKADKHKQPNEIANGKNESLESSWKRSLYNPPKVPGNAIKNLGTAVTTDQDAVDVVPEIERAQSYEYPATQPSPTINTYETQL